jgi:hypothetical protein
MERSGRKTCSFKLKPELVDEMRRAVEFASGHPRYLMLCEFMESCLRSGIEELRQELKDELKPFNGAFPSKGEVRQHKSRPARQDGRDVDADSGPSQG